MIQSSATCSLPSSAATTELAQRIARILLPGDVILLEGPIGAGKTHFARSLIQSLMPVPEDVPSPTYTLVQSYPGRQGEIWHADLYRLGNTNELVELGLDVAFETAFCLIEWPDRLGDLTPAGLHIDLAYDANGTGRNAVITATSDHFTQLAQSLARDFEA